MYGGGNHPEGPLHRNRRDAQRKGLSHVACKRAILMSLFFLFLP